MKMINISEAKTQLSAVIEGILKSGEDVIIGKAGHPVVRISRYEPAIKHKRLGCFKGKINVAKDFDEWPKDIAQSLGLTK
ncbi:MAG: prevent-host-death family protein [uncultured bacterium]|nr:MAG: prevent-host-death family protein [uncultured bacterium]